MQDREVAWNMSDQWLRDIAGICMQLTTVRREDNLRQAAIILCDLIDRMTFQFKPEETKVLRDLLQQMSILLDKPRTQQGMQLFVMDAPKIRQLISECYTKYLGALNNYERIFAKREVDIWKEIEGDFE